ncbi:hypothetical protein BsWGS_23780 [Bradybaena similaris]
MLKTFLILVLAIHCVVGTCDEGWVEYSGFCYSFNPELLNWHLAGASCLVHGGRLVKIEGQAEQDWIAGQLRQRKFTEAWIGGSSRLHKGSWRWIPSNLKIQYTNWYPNEPNNAQTENPIPANGEDCIHLGGTELKWNDRWCGKEFNFICEKKAT